MHCVYSTNKVNNGRQTKKKLERHGYICNKEFSFPIAEPTFNDARVVSSIMKRKFLNKDYDLIYLLYTHMETSVKMQPRAVRLFPVDMKSISKILPDNVTDAGMAIDSGSEVEYFPEVNAVFDYLIDSYANAMVFGAMVDAYASEQTARLTAMQNANDNASEMMKKLDILSNRARQARITTELTEIVNGAEQAGKL